MRLMEMDGSWIYAFQSWGCALFMRRQVFWVLGLVAPVFFAVSVGILASLRPGYSHVYNTISELGEAGSVTGFPAAWVFIVTEVMITGFGYGLHQVLLRMERCILVQ